jgi:hypothetical protein
VIRGSTRHHSAWKTLTFDTLVSKYIKMNRPPVRRFSPSYAVPSENPFTFNGDLVNVGSISVLIEDWRIDAVVHLLREANIGSVDCHITFPSARSKGFFEAWKNKAAGLALTRIFAPLTCHDRVRSELTELGFVGVALEAVAEIAPAQVQLAPTERLVSCTVDLGSNAGHDVEDIWPLHGDGGLHRILNSTGKGVRVALLDTGIDAAHPDVRRQLRGFKSFVPGEEAWLDQNGHGTQCASIITMVAPDCDLYVAKVLHDDQKPSRVRLMSDAIYWAVDEVECKVLSISAGTMAYNAGLCAAINHAIVNGVIVLCAAANYGRLFQSSIAYPAAFGNVICVGSHDERGQVSRYSSAGREVDFLAPGENILVAMAAQKNRSSQSGTSLSVPFAAGLCALLDARARGLGYELDNEAARILMRTLCTSPGTHDNARGYGVLKPMDQLRVQQASFIDKWIEDIFMREDDVQPLVLRNDQMISSANVAACTVPSPPTPHPPRRVHYFVSVALLMRFDEHCEHARMLTNSLVSVLESSVVDVSSLFAGDKTCKTCEAAFAAVSAVDEADRSMIHHFFSHARLKQDGNLDAVPGTWERGVSELLFGRHADGDAFGCWINETFDPRFYRWPELCDCDGAKAKLKSLPPAADGTQSATTRGGGCCVPPPFAL